MCAGPGNHILDMPWKRKLGDPLISIVTCNHEVCESSGTLMFAQCIDRKLLVVAI